ncbi:50S ribosomal protein L19 [Patescibacteria group bacterium]|nr:50S ribosomal protein L19 [Patescibacteria group bacterium]
MSEKISHPIRDKSLNGAHGVNLLETFVKNKNKGKNAYPEIKPGSIIRIHQKLAEAVAQVKSKKQAKTKAAEEAKERTQSFEGIVISRKGKNNQSTITVRKISGGIGVEYTLPLDLPHIVKIEIVKQTKVRRAKLYYLRGRAGKAARFKEIASVLVAPEEETAK